MRFFCRRGRENGRNGGKRSRVDAYNALRCGFAVDAVGEMAEMGKNATALTPNRALAALQLSTRSGAGTAWPSAALREYRERGFCG